MDQRQRRDLRPRKPFETDAGLIVVGLKTDHTALARARRSVPQGCPSSSIGTLSELSP